MKLRENGMFSSCNMQICIINRILFHGNFIFCDSLVITRIFPEGRNRSILNIFHISKTIIRNIAKHCKTCLIHFEEKIRTTNLHSNCALQNLKYLTKQKSSG